jgi:hypothetical protein
MNSTSLNASWKWCDMLRKCTLSHHYTTSWNASSLSNTVERGTKEQWLSTFSDPWLVKQWWFFWELVQYMPHIVQCT